MRDLPAWARRRPTCERTVGISIFTPRASTSGRAAVHSNSSISAGKRLIPRLFEYRLTKSHASRAYLLTPANPKYLITLGAKHSLCFTSMVSKTQPSESMPMRNGCFGVRLSMAVDSSWKRGLAKPKSRDFNMNGRSGNEGGRMQRVLAICPEGWISVRPDFPPTFKETKGGTLENVPFSSFLSGGPHRIRVIMPHGPELYDIGGTSMQLEENCRMNSKSRPKDSLKESKILLRLRPGRKTYRPGGAGQANHADQFQVEHALSAAQKVLADQVQFSLSPERWDDFCAALDAPPKVIPALRKLLKKPGVFH